jgi:hypothetical protein
MVEECGAIAKIGSAFLVKALMVKAWRVGATSIMAFMDIALSPLGFGGILTRVEEWKAGLTTARVLLGLVKPVTRFGAKLRALGSAYWVRVKTVTGFGAKLRALGSA